jgi:hypothetical protein
MRFEGFAINFFGDVTDRSRSVATKVGGRSGNGIADNQGSTEDVGSDGINLDEWLLGGKAQHEAEKLAVLVGLSIKELYCLDFREFFVHIEAHAEKEARERQKIGYLALLIRKAFHKKKVTSRDFFQDADISRKRGSRKLSIEEIKKKIKEDKEFFERIDRDIKNGKIVRGNKCSLKQ